MVHQCRDLGCARPAERENGFCAVCEGFTPICPVCRSVYGEHRTDCSCPDGYNDCNEGPWTSEEDARHFADCEVGLPFIVVRGSFGQWYVMVCDDEDLCADRAAQANKDIAGLAIALGAEMVRREQEQLDRECALLADQARRAGRMVFVVLGTIALLCFLAALAGSW